MDPTLLQPLVELGVPGVIIIALGYALWKRTEKYDDIMEKRISEGRESIEALNRSTAAMDTFSSKLEEIKRFLELTHRGGA